MFMSSWTGATRELIPCGYALEGGKGSTFMVGPFLQSAGPPMKILWRVRNFLHRRAISLAGSPAHHPPSIRVGLPTSAVTVIQLDPRHSRATCSRGSDRETPHFPRSCPNLWLRPLATKRTHNHQLQDIYAQNRRRDDRPDPAARRRRATRLDRPSLLRLEADRGAF